MWLGMGMLLLYIPDHGVSLLMETLYVWRSQAHKLMIMHRRGWHQHMRPWLCLFPSIFIEFKVYNIIFRVIPSILLIIRCCGQWLADGQDFHAYAMNWPGKGILMTMFILYFVAPLQWKLSNSLTLKYISRWPYLPPSTEYGRWALLKLNKTSY